MMRKWPKKIVSHQPIHKHMDVIEIERFYAEVERVRMQRLYQFPETKPPHFDQWQPQTDEPELIG